MLNRLTTHSRNSASFLCVFCSVLGPIFFPHLSDPASPIHFDIVTSYYIYIYGSFLKWGYPQIRHFNMMFHCKPSICRCTHHLWKPPYINNLRHSWFFSQKKKILKSLIHYTILCIYISLILRKHLFGVHLY